jgi:hypothetical protein
MKISQLLLETVDGKNLHLEHLDDEIWNRGYLGAVEAINYLEGAAGLLAGTTNQKYFATKKWDGSPALLMGTDPETGEFVMGDKGIFSKTKENKITKAEDIARVKPDKVSGGERVSYAGLRKKLKTAYEYLKDLNFGDKILQGDLLWTQGDGDSGFQNIDGVSYWTFKPNLITYAVPAESALAQRMSKAKVGIVFHTTYEGGPTLNDMTARFGADVSELGASPNVWYRDAGIKDVSGSVTLTQQEFDYLEEEITDIQSLLLAIGKPTFKWLEATAAGHVMRDLIKIDINKMVRSGALDQPDQYVDRFVNRLQERMVSEINKLKTQAGQERKQATWTEALNYIKQNRDNIEYVYMLFIKIQAVKDILQRHYSAVRQIDTFIQRPDGSFDVVPEEGVVIVDHLGKGGKEAVKIVDRLDFSRENFLKAARR